MSATESAAVLPVLRLGRLQEALSKITDDRHLSRQIMDAVEDHLERDAFRWGNACPEDGCGSLLSWRDGLPICHEHGPQRNTILLVGFRALGTQT